MTDPEKVIAKLYVFSPDTCVDVPHREYAERFKLVRSVSDILDGAMRTCFQWGTPEMIAMRGKLRRSGWHL